VIAAVRRRPDRTRAATSATAPAIAASAAPASAGAAAAAEQLSGSLGAEVLDAARLAFAQSFDLIAVVAAAVVFITAAFVAIVLREDAPQSEAAIDFNLRTAECLAS